MIEATSRAELPTPAIHCEECGYSLRGLPLGQSCPECGRPATIDRGPHPRVTWSRSIVVGLSLLILVTAHGVASVLIQPFTERIDGTLSAVNLPGPKLWAAPLLQRPIGRSPEQAGVVATQMAMLSLLAIWLISTPHPHRRDEALRLALRWVSTALFGAAYGAMLSSQGLWGGELPPLRLMLVAGVELPAGTLLYVYLARLAAYVPGLARRQRLNRLAWLAPLTIAAGAALTALRWIENDTTAKATGPVSLFPQHVAFMLNLIYGMLAVAVGAAATVAVASLTAAYVRPAFPAGWRLLDGLLELRAAMSRWIACQRLESRGCHLAVAAGAALLLLCMVVGNNWSLYLDPRATLGGLLSYNFTGPKLWASLTLYRFDGYLGRHDVLSLTTLLILNLVAVWLLTVRPPSSECETVWRKRLRLATRWAAVAAVGLAGGAMSTFTDPQLTEWLSRHPVRTYAVSMGVLELPATVLLYFHLAAVARHWNHGGLARGFAFTALITAQLIAMATLLFSGFTRPHRAGFSTAGLMLFGLYGAMSLLTAAWATAAVATLGCVALRRAWNDNSRSGFMPSLAPESPAHTPVPPIG